MSVTEYFGDYDNIMDNKNEDNFPIKFDTHRASCFITAAPGRGKTTLAKIIIQNNKPDRYVVFSTNKQDWDEPIDDIKKLDTIYQYAKTVNCVVGKPTMKIIVVFDDFNNQAGVNMWSNNTVNKVFTEGRKYNLHCILLSHSVKQTGKTAREACYYKILYRPAGVPETRIIADTFMYGELNVLMDLFRKCGKYDCVVTSLDGNKVLRPDNTTMSFKDITQNNSSNINIDEFMSSNSTFEGASSNNAQSANSQGIGIGHYSNNNTINQTSVMQTQIIETKQILQKQRLKHKMTLRERKNRMLEEQDSMKYEIFELLNQPHITRDELDTLIAMLMQLNQSKFVITTDTWKTAATFFLRKYHRAERLPKVCDARTTIGHLVKAGGLNQEFGVRMAGDYAGEFTDRALNFLFPKKKKTRRRRRRK